MALIVLLLMAAGLSAQPSPCAACHGEQVEEVSSHQHGDKGVVCATCHGPSEKHRLAVGGVPPDRVAAPAEVAALCGGCHAEERKEFDGSAHAAVYRSGKSVRTANCNTCHGHHAMRSWTALAAACSRCHVSLPASCKQTPGRSDAKVACMNCHARHTLAVKSGK